MIQARVPVSIKQLKTSVNFRVPFVRRCAMPASNSDKTMIIVIHAAARPGGRTMKHHRLRFGMLAALAAVLIIRSRISDAPATSADHDPAQRSATAAAVSTPRPPEVVIVGAGISGLSTALELGRSQARVTVVDMSSVFGGHAVMSQGGVCIVDSPVQRESVAANA